MLSRPLRRGAMTIGMTILFFCTSGCATDAPPDSELGDVPGACCTDDGCVETSEEECALQFDAPYFDDEFCGNAFSSCRGACCRNDDCFITAGQNECEGLGGEFRGTNTDCDAVFACGDAPDEPSPDSQQAGICCVDQMCGLMSLSACTGTVFLDRDDCNGVDCTQGACCDMLLDTCELQRKDECDDDPFGSYAGDGTTCEQADCTNGACCSADGETCVDTTDEMCVDMGGGFKGFGSRCDGTLCFTTACCASDGSCSDRVPEACVADGGTPSAAGQSCDSANRESGLCCAVMPSDEPYGDCQNEFTEFGCGARGGTFAGAGITCEQNTFEEFTRITITSLESAPSPGLFGESLSLSVNWSGNPTFPITLQGYIDVDACPPDSSCAPVLRRVRFRFDENEGNTLMAADWNVCPGFTTVTQYFEPWRFRILDAHCVASEEVAILVECAQ